MKYLLVAAFASVLTTPALALSDTECTAMWKQADANGDGTLAGAEADRYAAWMRIANREMPAGGAIDEKTFRENCMADIYQTASTMDAGAPLEGANSFTEGQAQDRAVAAGYTGVSAMTKDDKGIWRGTASKDGATVNVAVDYKGNVVTTK